MESQCISCLISRAYQEVQLASTDLKVQFEAMTEVVEILNSVLIKGGRLERIPAHVGTRRDHAIQRITGCPDPYNQLKQRSNEAALDLIQPLEDFVKKSTDPQQCFRRGCIVASLGNVIEYGVAGHEIPWDNLPLLVSQAESELAIDQISNLYKLARKAKRTLYLTDNAGEVVFDRLLIEALHNLGSHVIVAVKGDPILNDAMLEDAKVAGLSESAEIITTGGGAVGVLPLPQWCSDDFLNQFNEVDLVIAKGMGHHETLPEFSIPTPTAHLLRTKCQPIARSLNVAKNQNVVNVIINHQGPLGLLRKKNVK